MTTDRDALIAAWDGQPAADLTADITEIITKVGIGAENPTALAEEIAYVVMQHGRPVARPVTIDEDLAGAIKTLRFEADRADRHAEHDKRHREWADRTARALAAVEQLARDAGLVTDPIERTTSHA